MRTYVSAWLLRISLAMVTLAVFGGDSWSGAWANAGPVGEMLVKKSDTIRIKTSVVCGMCKERVEENLAFEKGVKDVSVDLETRIVTIRYNPKSTSPDELRKKLSKLGYDADEVAADPKAYEKLPACCKKDAPPH
jgi:copper chaperone CopZ